MDCRYFNWCFVIVDELLKLFHVTLIIKASNRRQLSFAKEKCIDCCCYHCSTVNYKCVLKQTLVRPKHRLKENRRQVQQNERAPTHTVVSTCIRTHKERAHHKVSRIFIRIRRKRLVTKHPIAYLIYLKSHYPLLHTHWGNSHLVITQQDGI